MFCTTVIKSAWLAEKHLQISICKISKQSASECEHEAQQYTRRSTLNPARTLNPENVAVWVRTVPVEPPESTSTVLATDAAQGKARMGAGIVGS